MCALVCTVTWHGLNRDVPGYHEQLGIGSRLSKGRSLTLAERSSALTLVVNSWMNEAQGTHPLLAADTLFSPAIHTQTHTHLHTPYTQSSSIRELSHQHPGLKQQRQALLLCNKPWSISAWRWVFAGSAGWGRRGGSDTTRESEQLTIHTLYRFEPNKVKSCTAV